MYMFCSCGQFVNPMSKCLRSNVDCNCFKNIIQ